MQGVCFDGLSLVAQEAAHPASFVHEPSQAPAAVVIAVAACAQNVHVASPSAVAAARALATAGVASKICFLLAQLLLSVTQLLPLLVQFLPQLGLILLLQKQQL